MAGDFNAQSSLDNDTYNYSLNDTRFMVHEYILENTPYVDVIKEMHQDEFKTTTSARSRIDFVYCSPAMMKNASNADVLQDSWTGTIVKDEATGFKYPSDHRPIYLRINVK
jgi:exonuclease III